MKIAILHSRLHEKGGTQRQLLSTAIALQKLGHDITIYTLFYSKENCFKDLLDQLHVVPLEGYHPESQKSKVGMLGFFNYLIYSRNESNAARAMAYKIDRDTEILHPYDRISYRVAAFYKTMIKDIPSVIMMDDIHTKLWSFWRKKQFDSKLRMPLRRRIFYWLVDWYEVRKFIIPHEGIIVLDERTKQWVKQYFHKDAAVVRSGLDLEKFAFFKKGTLLKSDIKLLATGALFLHRRYEDILQAVSILRNRGMAVLFFVVGDYEAPDYYSYYQRLSALSKELGVEDCVRFLGKVRDEELLRLLRECHVYISSNHLQSWGLSVFEAMACGLPVIVSRSTGAAEVLSDRENALLVNSKMPEEISSAIEELIKDQNLYDRLSIRGRSFVEENITWRKTAEELVLVFQRVLKRV